MKVLKVWKALQYDTDSKRLIEKKIDPENDALEGYIVGFLAQPECNNLHIAVICGGEPKWEASSLCDMVRVVWGNLNSLCITMREPEDKKENISCDSTCTENPSKCFVAYFSKATDKDSAVQSFWLCIASVLNMLTEYHKEDQIGIIQNILCEVYSKVMPMPVLMKGVKRSEISIGDKFDKLCQEINPLPQTFIVMYLPKDAFQWFKESVDCSISQVNYVFLVYDLMDTINEKYPSIKKELEDKDHEDKDNDKDHEDKDNDKDHEDKDKDHEIIDRTSKNHELIENAKREEPCYSNSGSTRTTENPVEAYGRQIGTTTKATNTTYENMDLHHESEEKAKQTEDSQREEQDSKTVSNHDNVYESSMEKAGKINDDGQERV